MQCILCREEAITTAAHIPVCALHYEKYAAEANAAYRPFYDQLIAAYNDQTEKMKDPVVAAILYARTHLLKKGADKFHVTCARNPLFKLPIWSVKNLYLEYMTYNQQGVFNQFPRIKLTLTDSKNNIYYQEDINPQDLLDMAKFITFAQEKHENSERQFWTDSYR